MIWVMDAKRRGTVEESGLGILPYKIQGELMNPK